MSTDLAIPASPELARKMPSAQLYALEQLGRVAREILDERVSAWTRVGWTQQRIAGELGCSQQSISKRQARLGIEPANPNMARDMAELHNPVVQSPDGPETVEPDEVLPPRLTNGRMPLPTNETVVNRLARTAEVDEQRAFAIWTTTVQRHGEDATPQQVAEVAAELGGHAPSSSDVDLVKEAKRCASAVSRAVRKQDPRAARRALAIWRACVYRELDRLASDRSR